eukprot:gene1289-biopygen9980
MVRKLNAVTRKDSYPQPRIDDALDALAGRLNGNADALSRRLYDAPLSSVEKGRMLSVSVAVLVPPCPPAESLNFLQRQDKDLAMIIAYLETSQLPSSDTQARNLLLTIDSYYLDERGLLCHWWTPGKRHVHSLVSQLVIPTSLRHDVLVACHYDPSAGHLSTVKTYEKVRSRYYWHGMYKDFEHWCHSCVDCAMKKIPRSVKARLLPIPVEGAFDRVAMDILGPFPATHDGNRYIIVFSDYYTRWPEAFALLSIEVSRIANLLVDEILARHGAPRTLLSDRGSNFLAAVVKETCRLMNTRRTHTTAYHPQTDGLVERFNGTLAEGLSMYLRTLDNRVVSVPVHANRLKPYCDPADRPLDAPVENLRETSDLCDSPDGFCSPEPAEVVNVPRQSPVTVTSEGEPDITRPEDTWTPDMIRNFVPDANPEDTNWTLA